MRACERIYLALIIPIYMKIFNSLFVVKTHLYKSHKNLQKASIISEIRTFSNKYGITF